MTIILVVFGVLLGAAMGSFACCQAWRIRWGEEGKKDPGKSSVCLKCGKKLNWYENIPIVSWLVQQGKCRKCGAKIGCAEILSELFGAISFGLIVYKFIYNAPEALAWIDWARLAFVLVMVVGMILLMVSDAKWQELPMKILILVIVMAFLYFGMVFLKALF